MVINSPNNPSGVVYPRENLNALGELLRRKGQEYGAPIYLISDEPYREVVYDGVEVPWVPHCYENTLVCYSYSKAISLPGERIGYVLVPPSMEDHDEVYQAVAGAGRAVGHINAPSLFQQVAAACDGMVSDLTAYTINRNLLYDNLTAMGFACVKPEGTFYLMVKSPEPDAAAFSQKAMALDLLFPDTRELRLSGLRADRLLCAHQPGGAVPAPVRAAGPDVRLNGNGITHRPPPAGGPASRKRRAGALTPRLLKGRIK